MPLPRNMLARSSQQRNSQQDDTPTRTRAARGSKPAPSKPDSPQLGPSKESSTMGSPNMTRKATRSALNSSNGLFETGPEIYASYEEPLFMVFGVPPEFFHRLKKHHGKLPKERKTVVESPPPPSPSVEDEENEENLEPEFESELDSDVDLRISTQTSSKGGRGRGGGRGGRGRGARGRGRGGRSWGGSARIVSPTRSRPARSAAPMYSLTEDDDEELPFNQSTPRQPFRVYESNPVPFSDTSEPDDVMPGLGYPDEALPMPDYESDTSTDSVESVRIETTTPRGSPPEALLDAILDGSYVPGLTSKKHSKSTNSLILHLSVPKTLLPTQSTTQSPRESTFPPAVIPEPTLLNPEDDVLTDSDLPEPWIEDAPSPMAGDCEDRADYLLQKRFKAMADVQTVIAALTKYPASQRSTANLYTLAVNTQRILKAWQDEYLMLDARTAPHMHPAKKACNGGRIPIAPEIFEDMKEADLYGYNYDARKHPGCQDPWTQRPGAGKGAGRELRTRRTRDILDSAAPSEEEEDEDIEGRSTRRQRKATRRFDGTDTGTGNTTPKRNSGWGGARKKGVSRFASAVSETPEPEGKPAKRARTVARNFLHARIQEMREDSVPASSGDEGSSAMDVDDYSDTNNPKRGRPAGSKNQARRSDYGIKKGPRKKTSEKGTPAPTAPGSSAPSMTLSSMTEGQGQFTIDEKPSTIPIVATKSVEAVFQATPQPHITHEVPLVHPSESHDPDAFILTAPLSQYTNNYMDDSSPASGSRRKPRVKSEKRSQSMTIWWAERKARKREQDERNGTPPKFLSSRSISASRRGGGISGGPAANSTNSALPARPQTPPEPHPLQQAQQAQQLSPVQQSSSQFPQDYYATHYGAPKVRITFQYTDGVILQPTHIPAPMTFGVPPHPIQPILPVSGLSNSQHGPRALAPAPTPLQPAPTYPSPYGPQSPASSRSKSSVQPPRIGPPPLAPAPSPQINPYGPSSVDGSIPFKVMIPGPAPGDIRRESH